MASVYLPLLSVAAAAGLVSLSDARPAASPVASATADLARSPATAPSTGPRPAEDIRTLQRAPDGLFYADALVDGQPVHFVVDTGATVTVLSPTDAARIGAKADHTVEGGNLDTAAGSTAMRWSKPAEIRVAGHTIADVQTALPTGEMRVSLMGQDVLSRLDSLTLRGDRLTLE